MNGQAGVSEMDGFAYRGSPIEPITPLVHAWLGSAVRAWNRWMYGRRRWWFAWDWLLLVVLLAIAVKAVIFLTGVLLLTVAFGLSVLYDLASYPLRRRAARPALGN